MDKQEQEQAFDEAIRKKLSQSPASFDESAWEKLEQRLDAIEHGGPLKMAGWWIRGAAAALLLLGLGIGYYLFFYGEGRPPRLAGTESRKEIPSAPAPQDRGVDGPVSREGEAARQPSPETGRDASEGLAAGSSRERAGEAPGQSGSGSPEDLAAEPAGKPLRQTELALEGRGLSPRLESVPLPGIRGIPGEALAFEPSPLETSPEALPVPQAAPGFERPSSRPLLTLGVAAAPDLNAVRSFEQGELGLNAGLSLGLHLSERFSVHTGLTYAAKPYGADPSDYGSGQPRPGLTHIAARCQVIDIPLNVQYAFYRKGRNSVALNAGLSSYLMLKESYRYDYEYADSRRYEYRNENQHFLGVGHAGLVYERRLGPATSLGVQPFVKIPLTGIGQGDVRLISTGLSLQLNFQVLKK